MSMEILVGVSRRTARINVGDVIVRDRQRQVDPKHVEFIKESFELLGSLQIQDIVVNEDMVLVDGAHRLTAARELGWDEINAIIVDGLTEDDRAVVEAEANRVRKQLSPVELERIWTAYYEPLFKARGAEKRELGADQARLIQAANRANGDAESGFPQIAGTHSEQAAAHEPATTAQAAKQVTGLDIRTLNMISDIHQMAHNEKVDPTLREAAMKGLKKLDRPNAVVGSVHGELLKLQERKAAQGENPAERLQRENEKLLGKLLDDSTMMAERLTGDMGGRIREAAAQGRVAAEETMAIRVALTNALASIVVIECNLHDDAGDALQTLGKEISQTLAENTTAELNRLGRTE